MSLMVLNTMKRLMFSTMLRLSLLSFFGMTISEAKERYRELCGCDPEGDAMMFEPHSRAFCVAYGTDIAIVTT